jgi:hypothetical protein
LHSCRKTLLGEFFVFFFATAGAASALDDISTSNFEFE